MDQPTGPRPTPAGRWDAALLAPIIELNEQLLSLLSAQAQSPGRLPPLLSALRSKWRALELAQRQRLATCPYLLLDGGFARSEGWHTPPIGTVRDSARGGYFDNAEGVTLLRRVWHLAWHFARSNRWAARVMLGMGDACAERLSRWRLSDIDTLAEFAPAWVTPRWESQVLVWEQLLDASAREDMRLRQMQLRGVQLLAAAMGEPSRARRDGGPAALC